MLIIPQKKKKSLTDGNSARARGNERQRRYWSELTRKKRSSAVCVCVCVSPRSKAVSQILEHPVPPKKHYGFFAVNMWPQDAPSLFPRSSCPAASEYQTMETQDSETERSPGIGFTDRAVGSRRAANSAKWDYVLARSQTFHYDSMRMYFTKRFPPPSSPNIPHKFLDRYVAA